MLTYNEIFELLNNKSLTDVLAITNAIIQTENSALCLHDATNEKFMQSIAIKEEFSEDTDKELYKFFRTSDVNETSTAIRTLETLIIATDNTAYLYLESLADYVIFKIKNEAQLYFDCEDDNLHMMLYDNKLYYVQTCKEIAHNTYECELDELQNSVRVFRFSSTMKYTDTISVRIQYSSDINRNVYNVISLTINDRICDAVDEDTLDNNKYILSVQ